MAITEIEYGSLATSKKLNDNFNALNESIQELATNLETTNSSLATSMSTLNKNLNSQLAEANTSLASTKEELEQKIEELEQKIEDLDGTLSQSITWFMPDWDKKVNRGTTYTLEEDSWVYLVAKVGWANTSSSSKAGDVCIGGGLGRSDSSMRVGGMWIGVKGEKISGSFTIYTVPFVGRSE